MEEVHTCPRCNAPKSLSAFSKNKGKPNGRNSWCKQCASEHSRILVQSSPEKSKHRLLLYMYHGSKRRAREKGLEHSITVDYLYTIIPEKCPYLDIEINWQSSAGTGIKTGPRYNGPSIDRIDSSKGYVEGNVLIVSFRANSIKNNANETELIKMGRRLAQLKMEMAMPE